MQSHISCMCVLFSNVSFHVSSQNACLNRCKVTRVADMRNFSIKWFSNVFSNRLIEQMQSHISCMCVVFSNVSFHVSFQITCLNRCKSTRVADMQNFSIKWFSNVFSNRLLEQMQSHNSCMCVIFSNGSFHMSSQIAYLNRCKVTIVVDVQNFSNMSQKNLTYALWQNNSGWNMLWESSASCAGLPDFIATWAILVCLEISMH